MSGQWALCLDPRHLAAAAALRTYRGVEACQIADALWLRGPRDAGPLERAMWLLPGERFHLTEKSQLIPWNHLLPVTPAPAGPWLPLSTETLPTLAPAALPASNTGQVPLRLVRVAQEQPASLLLLALPTWSNYVDTAPTIRLSRLRFAQSNQAQILVAGAPLPALPGTPCTLSSGIALPCGWAFSPAVRAETLAELLALAKDDIALFSPDAAYDLIPATAWQPVSRSAVRISADSAEAGP